MNTCKTCKFYHPRQRNILCKASFKSINPEYDDWVEYKWLENKEEKENWRELFDIENVSDIGELAGLKSKEIKFGTCSSDFIKYQQGGDEDFWDGSNQFFYWDYEGYKASHRVFEDFGCIHHKEIETKEVEQPPLHLAQLLPKKCARPSCENNVYPTSFNTGWGEKYCSATCAYENKKNN